MRQIELRTLGRRAAEAVGRAAEGSTVAVTRKGRPLAVMVNAETYQRLLTERELLRRLALGELECAAGDGHDIDAVIEDCALLVEEC